MALWCMVRVTLCTLEEGLVLSSVRRKATTCRSSGSSDPREENGIYGTQHRPWRSGLLEPGVNSISPGFGPRAWELPGPTWEQETRTGKTQRAPVA